MIYSMKALGSSRKDNELFSQLQRAHSLEVAVDIALLWILPLLGDNSHYLTTKILHSTSVLQNTRTTGLRKAQKM